MRYSFDEYVLDLERRELVKSGRAIDIEPQVFDLLVFLIRNRERVVSRDDLIAGVWGGRIVSESALASRVNAVRRAIGDDGTAQRLVKTMVRKGFRFVGDVRENAEGAALQALSSDSLAQTISFCRAEMATGFLMPGLKNHRLRSLKSIISPLLRAGAVASARASTPLTLTR